MKLTSVYAESATNRGPALQKGPSFLLGSSAILYSIESTLRVGFDRLLSTYTGTKGTPITAAYSKSHGKQPPIELQHQLPHVSDDGGTQTPGRVNPTSAPPAHTISTTLRARPPSPQLSRPAFQPGRRTTFPWRRDEPGRPFFAEETVPVWLSGTLPGFDFSSPATELLRKGNAPAADRGNASN